MNESIPQGRWSWVRISAPNIWTLFYILRTQSYTASTATDSLITSTFNWTQLTSEQATLRRGVENLRYPPPVNPLPFLDR